MRVLILLIFVVLNFSVRGQNLYDTQETAFARTITQTETFVSRNNINAIDEGVYNPTCASLTDFVDVFDAFTTGTASNGNGVVSITIKLGTITGQFDLEQLIITLWDQNGNVVLDDGGLTCHYLDAGDSAIYTLDENSTYYIQYYDAIHVIESNWTSSVHLNLPEPRPFITTWKTDNSGTSCSSCITIPTNAASGPYSYDVDWENDGTYDDFGVSGDITHDYGSPGTYQVAIRGDFPHIYFNYQGDREKILSIDQWGDLQWSDMTSAFYGCTNLILLSSESPILANASSTANMFAYCTSFIGDLSHWDVSNIIYMGGMFSSCYSFDSDIASWDVGNVTQMYSMFRNASVFNHNIGGWDVSNVKNMSYMFRNARKFNQDISSWNTSKLTNMGFIFMQASSFNQDISQWDVSIVQTMTTAFYQAYSFDQNIGTWDISNVIWNSAGSTNGLMSLLDYSGISRINYDNILKGWANNSVTPNNLSLGSTNMKYCISSDLRDYLINVKGWTITGDTYTCPELTAEVSDACYSGTSKEISSALANNNEDNHFYDSNGNLICTINANGNDLGMVDVDVYLSSTNRSANIPYINRDISITPANQPSSPVTVRIYYTASELAALKSQDPSITDYNDLDFTKTSVACSGTLGGSGELVLQASSGEYFTNGDVYVEAIVSSFSTFHANGQGLVLPVQLLNFELTNDKGKSFLTWKTSSESNNQGFEIQHSTNGASWNNIGWQEGAANSTKENKYDFTHYHPAMGINYYRLKQIDYDGHYEFHEIKSVTFENFHSDHIIYPNPVSDVLNLNKISKYEILNINGTKVKSGSDDKINVIGMKSGLYFIRIDGKNHRFIKT